MSTAHKTAKRITLRDECLAENKELGLEDMQEQMDLIFSVLHQHGINSQLWLEEYLAACEANGGNAPPDVDNFLPWNLSVEKKKRLSKNSTFTHGKALFVRTNRGAVYHVRKDGRRVKIDFGEMTAEELEQLARDG